MVYSKTNAHNFVYQVYHMININLMAAEDILTLSNNYIRFDLVGFATIPTDTYNIIEYKDALFGLYLKLNSIAVSNGLTGLQLLNYLDNQLLINENLINPEKILNRYYLNLTEWYTLKSHLRDIRVFNSGLTINGDSPIIFDLLNFYRYQDGSLLTKDEVYNLFGVTCGLGESNAKLRGWADYFGDEL